MKPVPKDKMVDKGVSERVTIVVNELCKAKAYKNKDMLATDMGISKTALYQAMRVGIMGKKLTDALTDLGYSYKWLTTGKGDRRGKDEIKHTLTDIQQTRVDVNKLRIDIAKKDERLAYLEKQDNYKNQAISELEKKVTELEKMINKKTAESKY